MVRTDCPYASRGSSLTLRNVSLLNSQLRVMKYGIVTYSSKNAFPGSKGSLHSASRRPYQPQTSEENGSRSISFLSGSSTLFFEFFMLPFNILTMASRHRPNSLQPLFLRNFLSSRAVSGLQPDLSDGLKLFQDLIKIGKS